MRNRRRWIAKPTVVDGIRFASKAEAKRYGELKLMERAGKISDLKVHPVFDLITINGVVKTTYVADFSYVDHENEDRLAVEDVKSKMSRTPIYKIKRDLMILVHGIIVREIEA